MAFSICRNICYENNQNIQYYILTTSQIFIYDFKFVKFEVFFIVVASYPFFHF